MGETTLWGGGSLQAFGGGCTDSRCINHSTGYPFGGTIRLQAKARKGVTTCGEGTRDETNAVTNHFSIFLNGKRTHEKITVFKVIYFPCEAMATLVSLATV